MWRALRVCLQAVMKQILSLNRASVRSYNCLFVELRVLHNSNWHQSEDILSPAQSQTS